ncbi:hypothetical protein FRC04_009188, partial [Tulasnella sp. 424]
MQIFPSLHAGYSTYDPDKEIPYLQGKVILVTGANAGLGYKSAEMLASKGAKVYVGARDETRGNAAVQSIRDRISSLSSAGSAGAEAFLRLENRLDVLIHNAGMQVKGYSTVSEGGLTFNKIMSTNHLGSFVLTQELMPVLKRTAAEPNSDVRIVVVSSAAHLQAPEKPDFRNLEGWNAPKGDGVRDSFTRYAVTKLANVLFTRELQSRLDAENVPITCIALHPGLVVTEGASNPNTTGILTYLWKLIMATLALNLLEGSYTILFAATSQKIKEEPTKYKGSYLQPFNRLAEISAYAKDGQLAKDLWACSEE